MPEGDTVHSLAGRINLLLGGREMGIADAPNPRSPLHQRAPELEGRTLELAEALGKHMLIHFSGALVLHSHLGMNGRWWIAADGEWPRARPWLRLASGPALAVQTGGRLLRLSSEVRARNDPTLRALGPDPLRAGFDLEAAARRLRSLGADRELGEALLDQRILAGIGNAIRNEACFAARIDPWRRVVDLSAVEIEGVVREAERIMQVSLSDGQRPRGVHRADRRGCPACGGPVSARGQGDANRTAFWCPRCQR
ncbi:MAG: hypothetical protein GEU88_01765 [Solirubrobacterales bacterium]|nr:hypothetical protein [Solirubrobacterales bacterium]